ncbi:AraC family transcriptional regulator [Pelagicoccus sp. SDUM812003]|uniref:AraC family transcriptional regulator n=1 Tax=Pelagicoccus sp. SDUM812003 TaxID=3041267 RepID=UPI00280CA116|nr:AraC family transcriptional regulator [Pelagicoccus sp. SDUM812003]MDQ8203306.1 AraC family transcriptional regulator [Pelagicoccus sp. SDUM812003]
MANRFLNRVLGKGRLVLNATPTLYHCEPIWSWQVDPLPDHALLLILGGRGEIHIDQGTHPLRQGVCFFIRPGAHVEAQQNPSYPLFLFIARFDLLDEHETQRPPDLSEEPADSLFIRNTRSLETLAEIIAGRSTNRPCDDPLTEDALNMLIRLLVEEASRHSGHFDARAYEALRAIENDLARKWTIKELAQEAELSPSSFARAFRNMMNEPPIQYLIRRRMEESKRQIQQSSLSIEEIAINLGYNDVSFFRELFTRRIGHSPESFRENRGF